METELRDDSANVEPVRSFVGRARELDDLQTELSEAASGRGRLILVSGEPGIGKTRLAEELADHARAAGALVVWGRCWEGEGAPAFWPWVQVIRRLSESVTAAELGESLGGGAAYLAGVVPELAERLGRVPPAPTSPESEHARFYLFDAVTAFLKRISTERPLLLVLDDLHWADRSSLLLLEFVAGELRDARTLVIGTYREGEVRSEVSLAEVIGGLSRASRSLPLRGLTEAEVGLLMERTGGRRPDARLVAAVHRTTDGNPFFVDEIVRLLAAEGITQARPGERLPIPEGVRAAIRRRISHLPGETRELLSIGSVVGRELDVGTLERATGRGASELLGALAAAVDAGLLTRPPGRAGTYAFAHAVVRETLYDDLAPPERVRLHRRIGEALEDLHAADLEAHVAELAHHFLEAAADGDAEKAIDYSERAGHRALAIHAYEEAAGHFEHALRMGAARKIDPARRGEILLALGRARERGGDTGKSGQALREAADLARKHRLPSVLALAALDFGTRLAADPDRVALLVEALEALPRDDTVLRARVMGALAVELVDGAEPEMAVPLIEESVAMARRLGDRPALARTLVARYHVLWLLPDVTDRPRPPFEDSRVVEELGDKELDLQLRAIRIRAFVSLADVEGARREIAAFRRTAGELHQPTGQAMGKVLEASLAAAEGRFEEAEHRLFGAIEEAGRFPFRQFGGTLTMLRMLQGRLDEIVDAFDSSVPFYRGSLLLAWRCAHAAVMAEIGREADARRELESLAKNDFADLPRGRSFVASLVFLAEACHALADRARATHIHELLRPPRLCPTRPAPRGRRAHVLARGSRGHGWPGSIGSARRDRRSRRRRFFANIEPQSGSGSPEVGVGVGVAVGVTVCRGVRQAPSFTRWISSALAMPSSPSCGSEKNSTTTFRASIWSPLHMGKTQASGSSLLQPKTRPAVRSPESRWPSRSTSSTKNTNASSAQVSGMLTANSQMFASTRRQAVLISSQSFPEDVTAHARSRSASASQLDCAAALGAMKRRSVPMPNARASSLDDVSGRAAIATSERFPRNATLPPPGPSPPPPQAAATTVLAPINKISLCVRVMTYHETFIFAWADNTSRSSRSLASGSLSTRAETRHVTSDEAPLHRHDRSSSEGALDENVLHLLTHCESSLQSESTSPRGTKSLRA
ncbi:MAG: ATP-binding protein [Candidatus Binatia bacterium]